MNRLHALAVAAACTCIGCAGPRAVTPPTLPVVLVESAAPRAGAVSAFQAIDLSRPDELQLDDLHFVPPLTATLRDYLRRELGATAADKDLRMQRLSVKLKSLAAPSETAPAVVAATRAQPPTVPPGAGLVGALIGAAIVEGIQSRNTRSFVLVNVEGEFGGEVFAGFAYGAYDEGDAASVARVVRDAFAQARDSLAQRAAFRSAADKPVSQSIPREKE